MGPKLQSRIAGTELRELVLLGAAETASAGGEVALIAGSCCYPSNWS